MKIYIAIYTLIALLLFVASIGYLAIYREVSNLHGT